MAEEKTIKIEGATIEGIVPAAATVTDTGGGAAVQGNVETGGGHVIGRDDMRYSPSGNISGVTFTNQDNAMLWNALIALSEKVNVVDVKLDDLPNRVGKLEVKVDPASVPIALTFPPTFWAMMAIIAFGLLAVAFFVGRGF